MIFNVNRFLPFFNRQTNEIEKSIIDKEVWTDIYYQQLSNIVLGIFDYKNLSMQNRERIKKSYFYYTKIGCVKDEKFGLVFSPVSQNGEIGILNDCNTYTMDILNNSKIYTIDKDIVVGCNYDYNLLDDNTICFLFAQQLADLKLSIINSTILSRYSANIVGDENSIRENKQIFDHYQIGKVSFFTKSRISDNLSTINFVPPTAITDYYNARREIVNEFLECLGLSSLVNPNKKERLLTDEITSNDDIKSTLMLNKINNRILFIENVNKMFNTDIKIVIADVVKDIDNLYKDIV